MQPWKISAGLTAAIAGTTFLLGGSRLEYLSPYWPLILADHGAPLSLHLAFVLAAVAAIIYGIARAAGLAERSVRRGEGDPGLTEALRQDAQGDWD